MPKLVVIKGPLKDHLFDLGEKEIVFCGRNPRMNDIAIMELAVSRKHFKIFRIGKDYFIEDLNSKHGTMVNGDAIEPGEGFQVNEGDLVAVGNTVMQFTYLSGEDSKLKSVQISGNFSGDTPIEEEPKKERRSAKEIELVFNVSELLKKQLDTHVFLKEFLKLVLKELPRLDNASIFLFQDKNYNWKKAVEVVPDSQEKTASKYKKEILNRVVMEKKTVRISNTEFELPRIYRQQKPCHPKQPQAHFDSMP